MEVGVEEGHDAQVHHSLCASSKQIISSPCALPAGRFSTAISVANDRNPRIVSSRSTLFRILAYALCLSSACSRWWIA